MTKADEDGRPGPPLAAAEAQTLLSGGVATPRHDTVRLRPAAAIDLDVLLDLLLEAFNWSGEARVTREQMLADPHTARYLGGWMRPGDFGVVATEESSSRPLGAIWARALRHDEPGYGYVADDVPELGIATAPGHRGRGVGTALLSRCIDDARGLGWRALSLSVEDGNTGARALYERHGFVVVGRNGGSDTMLLALR